MNRPHFIGGALLAALAAAPVLMLVIPMDLALTGRPLRQGQVVNTIAVLLIAWPFAFAIALLPALAGAAALAAIGKEQRWARHPLAWVAAGLLIGGTLGNALSGSPADARPVAIAGALAALLARWRTSWPAEQV